MTFERKLYQSLLQWKQESRGTTAMLIKGARRVGKSTLANQFGKNQYETFIAIDAKLPIEILNFPQPYY